MSRRFQFSLVQVLGLAAVAGGRLLKSCSVDAVGAGIDAALKAEKQ